MAKYVCLSCGATYDPPNVNPNTVPHVCPAQIIKTHAVCDPATGAVVTPAVYVNTPNPRNENIRPDLVYVDGKPHVATQRADEPGRVLYTPAPSFIIAEGNGRALAQYDAQGNLLPAGAAIVERTVPGT